MKPKKSSLMWGILFLLAMLVVAIPIFKFASFALTPFHVGAAEFSYIVVQKGQSPNDLTKTLTSQGIIADGKEFIWIGRLTRQWKKIKAGEYKVSPSMTPIELFTTLTSGISAAHPITIREGENMYEVADDLEFKGLIHRTHFLFLCKDLKFITSLSIFKESLPINLEGYFFPDTYNFDRTLSDEDMIRQMIKHFTAFWGPKEDARAKELHLTRHQIITLASMIEKETGAPEERTLISSVFHNRIRKKMRLQSDPTTIYGMWDRYSGKIHKRDLSAQNNYNTYYVNSLPVGPISNPGKDAIQAALFPADTSFLYFVSHNDGTSQFSKTIEEHNRAVQKFQLNARAREGKSWRDHLKKPASVSPASEQPR